MKYSVYVKGYKFYYSAETIYMVDVAWCDEKVIQLKNPDEMYDENFYCDSEKCGIVGDVLIPKSQVSHIIVFTDTPVHNSPTKPS